MMGRVSELHINLMEWKRVSVKYSTIPFGKYGHNQYESNFPMSDQQSGKSVYYSPDSLRLNAPLSPAIYRNAFPHPEVRDEPDSVRLPAYHDRIDSLGIIERLHQ